MDDREPNGNVGIGVLPTSGHPTAPEVKISFVVLTWNSRNHIARCIDSLLENVDMRQDPYELLIVDNGSRDGTVGILESYAQLGSPAVRPTYLPANIGTTRSRNIALRQARGFYVCVLDSDVVVPAGTVQHLLGVLEEDLSVGLAAPRLTYGNGNVQKSTDRFPSVQSKFARYLFLKRQERIENAAPPPPAKREVDYAISAFWLFRRSLLDEVGLLDEEIFYAPEDVDYCLRIWKAGLRVICDSRVSAVHDAQEISRGLRFNKATLEHVRGLVYFMRKHRCFIGRPNLKCGR